MTFPLTENVWRILKGISSIVAKTCWEDKWDKVRTETLHNMVSSMPESLLSVVIVTLQYAKSFTVSTFSFRMLMSKTDGWKQMANNDQKYVGFIQVTNFQFVFSTNLEM